MGGSREGGGPIRQNYSPEAQKGMGGCDLPVQTPCRRRGMVWKVEEVITGRRQEKKTYQEQGPRNLVVPGGYSHWEFRVY